MDWSGYDLLFLPNLALMDEDARQRLERSLAESPQTRFVAEGSFGLYSEDGQSSYDPPEGFGERFGVRVADFSQVTALDIEEGRNLLRTPLGNLPVATPCGYAVLEPAGGCEGWATLDGQTVGVRTADGRFTWLGLTLSAGFAEEAPPELVLGLAAEAGVRPPVRVEGAEVVPVVRPSRQGGWLLFLLNMRRSAASAQVRTEWKLQEVEDLFTRSLLPLSGAGFEIGIDGWEMAVLHCREVEAPQGK